MDDGLAKTASTDNSTALVIGDKIYFQALYADNKPFVFSVPQMKFLLALQTSKSLDAAMTVAGYTLEQTQRFLNSRKFKSFVSSKMQESSVKNGMTIEWWYQFGRDTARGFRDWYEGFCEMCHEASTFNVYEVESCRADDMKIKAQCPVCFQDVALEHKTEKFEPSREAVVAWQEIGSRLIPKIERVQHEFARETFEFQSQEVA